MTPNRPTYWPHFKSLCRVLGDEGKQTLDNCLSAGLAPQLTQVAESNDVLPALAARCTELTAGVELLHSPEGKQTEQALRDNTVRNMQIKAQALKLGRQLNSIGIMPMFLKGTIGLLESENTNIGFRKQVDIDLLVESEQLEATGDVFLANGYNYMQFGSGQAGELPSVMHTLAAIKTSAAHHHLPPLLKQGYAASVELHRHYLPKQQQRKNSLEALFNSAITREEHGVRYLVPSREYQIIHLILGKFVHDDHLARRTFPLREGCDFMGLINNSSGTLDLPLIKQHCGASFETVYALATQLMDASSSSGTKDISKRIKLMQHRYNMPAVGNLLDAHGRGLHLARSLIYSPAKLPVYLSRLIGMP